MKAKVNNLIEKYDMLHRGDTIIVGVSGGADSVCLLFLLCELKSLGKIDADIEVVHINHMIRETATRDEDFVRDLCMEFENRFGISLPYHGIRINVHKYAKDHNMSVEEAGRCVRYDAFNEILGSRKGVIAVAHHANDCAETMLFNLFRGSGLKGLSGISPVNGNIIRPLLNLERAEIEEMIKEEGLSFVTDETNLTDDYTRNKIRHNILEYAEREIISGVVSNMSKASSQLLSAEDYINECTKKASLRCVAVKEPGRVIIGIGDLTKEHEYLIDRIIYNSIVYVAEHKKDITSEHVRRIRLLLDTMGTKKVSLPYGVLVIKEYDRLSFIRGSQEEKNENLPIDECFSMNVLTEFSIEDIPTGNYTKWFDYDRITSVATPRYRGEGDYLIINKDMQRKSLKDYMVNEKIPSDDRGKIPLLADKDHIMWVVGYRISEYYKVNSETKRVLEVKYGRTH